jgi:single-stranded-DNA-specific exonuclease
VIGIVASQVADNFGRPAVLIGVNEGVGRGSARGVDGISIYEILNACRDLFLDFGGHEGAAGFEILAERIPELARRLKEEADQRIREEDLVPVLEIDAEIVPEQITLNVVKELDKLAPFGEGNPTPVFMSRGLKIVEMRKVGPDGRHFKAKMTDGKVNLEIIAFRRGDFADKLSYGTTYDIAYELSANEWNGFENVQLNLVDIKEKK